MAEHHCYSMTVILNDHEFTWRIKGACENETAMNLFHCVTVVFLCLSDEKEDNSLHVHNQPHSNLNYKQNYYIKVSEAMLIMCSLFSFLNQYMHSLFTPSKV